MKLKERKRKKREKTPRYFAAFEELLDRINDILFDVGNERCLSDSIWIVRLAVDSLYCQSSSPRKRESYSSVCIAVHIMANQWAPIKTGIYTYFLPSRLTDRFKHEKERKRRSQLLSPNTVYSSCVNIQIFNVITVTHVFLDARYKLL